MAPTAANPGEALWIGNQAGQNHFKIDIGLGDQGGSDDLTISQGEIQSGEEVPNRFFLTTDPIEGQVVEFRINAGASKTSENTKFPRSEMRAMLQNGTSPEAWNGGSGVHYMQYRAAVVETTTNRSWMCFGQIHDPNTDNLRIQCQGTGTTGLDVVARVTRGGSEQENVHTLIDGTYDLGTFINIEIRVANNNTLTIRFDGQLVLTVPNMNLSGAYFKVGAYLQSNVVDYGEDPNDEGAVQVVAGSLVVWHTGYPDPTPPVWTGPEGGDPGDTIPPTIPTGLVAVHDDQQVSLAWNPSTDNVGVDHYNVYRTGGVGGGTPANFGKTDDGGASSGSSANRVWVSTATPGSSGTAHTATARMWLSAAGSNPAKAVIYADSAGAPGALLAESDELTITETVEGPRTFTFSGANRIPLVSGTPYWIGVAWPDPDPSGATISMNVSRGATGSSRPEQSLTWPTMPNPFGAPLANGSGPIDVYVTYLAPSTETFGKDTAGTSQSTSSTDKIIASSAAPSAGGTLTGGHARLWLSGAGSSAVKMLVYADAAGAPGALLAESDAISVTDTVVGSVQDFVFSGAEQITLTQGVTYWIGVFWQDPGAVSATYSRAGSANLRHEHAGGSFYPTAPDPWTTTGGPFDGPIDAWLEYATSGGTTLIAQPTTTSYVDTGLTNGVEYTYMVSAVDAAGNESGQAGPVSATPGEPDTTAPTVPTDLAAVGLDRKVELVWGPSTDDVGVTAYLIYRDGALLASTSTTFFTDTLVSNGTPYSYTVTARDAAGNESAPAGPALATPTAPPIGGVPWLTTSLGPTARLEVAIAWGADLGADPDSWVWTDVTADVRVKSGISTRLGRNDESSTSNPATLELVLTNTSGDYSLGGTSANWPHVRRNTPVRLRIDPGDGGGGRVVLFAFADGFTPGWDALHGRIAVANLSASGALRRMQQGAAPVVSAFRRAMTERASVKAYWPFEEGRNATRAPAVRGGSDMTFVVGGHEFDSASPFDCSAPLVTLRSVPAGVVEQMTATVDPYIDTGETQVRWLMAIPRNGLPHGAFLADIFTTGTAARWSVTYSDVNANGGLNITIWDSNNVPIREEFNIDFGINGKNLRFSLEMEQVGSTVEWRMAAVEPGSTLGGFFSETLPGRTVGIVEAIAMGGNDVDDTVLGHVTLEDQLSSQFDARGPLAAYSGEFAVSADPLQSRLHRLCRENRVGLTLYGGVVGANDLLEEYLRMGPQLVSPLLPLLREVETANQGQLWDGLDAGLSYSTQRRRSDDFSRITIDAAAGQLAPPFEPVDDDQRNANRVDGTIPTGVTARYEDVNGPLGTKAVGFYDSSIEVNVADDAMAVQYAAWLVRLGTVEGARFPKVTVDLRASPELAGTVLNLVPGDRMTITNVDQVLTTFPAVGDVLLLIESIGHQITADTWKVEFTCSPWSPWGIGRIAAESGDTSDTLWRLDTDGSIVVGDHLAGATSLTVASDPLPVATDTFTRTATASWGVADLGGSYALAGTSGSLTGDFDVNGAFATMEIWANQRMEFAYLQNLSATDVDVTVETQLPFSDVTGGVLDVGNIMIRGTSLNDYLYAHVQVLTNQAVAINIVENVGATETIISNTLVVSELVFAGALQVRIQAHGRDIRARVWDPFDPEPDVWHATAEVSVAVAGWIGIRNATGAGNTNAKPVIFGHDNLVATSIEPPGGPPWTTAADDYPLTLSVGGLPVRATACTGVTSPQTFTVDPLPADRGAGTPVKLWDPRPIGL